MPTLHWCKHVPGVTHQCQCWRQGDHLAHERQPNDPMKEYR